MVDSLKNLTSLPNAVVSNTPQGDALRKNLKALSPVSVSSAAEKSGANANAAQAEAATRAVVNLTDAVQLSAEALRSLGKSGESSEGSQTQDPELVEENVRAASASPEDVEQARENASRAGSAIQFRREEALYAHGSGISPEKVYKLLED